ncbi:MAG: carboxypeptidase regulatory-like domain-containing protein [Anaerolineales bacterium]|nr:MAG: carboxypeptidase regulatory-like domain-containing protein [Anaerolineales bacterium]
MNKWNLVIDIAKCHDCNNCFLACKDEYCENDFPPYSAAQPRHGHRWIDILRKERGQHPRVDVSYLPLPCMHCDEADCIKAAEGEAVYKRDDGIVIIDPLKAKGQKGVVDSCPYGVIWWNEELDVPQKCTFCAHLLDEGWQAPRCVQACPTGAMEFLHVEDAEMQRIVHSEELEVWHPEYGLEPRVYYKKLYRYTRWFISGSVALKDVDECAEGAKVTLKNGSGGVLITALTNNYGDFRFDALEAKSGQYRLEVDYPGYQQRELRVDLENSIDVGTIFL